MIDKKALKTLMDKCKERGEELRQLDVIEAEAKRAIDEVVEAGDIGSEAAQRKTGDARMRLDMVAARRKKLKGLRVETHALESLYRAEADKFNNAVTAALAALEEKYIVAMVPFFGGDEVECRLYLENRKDRPPLFHEFRRCYYNFPTYGRPEERVLEEEVRGFIAQIERDSKIIGLA